MPVVSSLRAAVVVPALACVVAAGQPVAAQLAPDPEAAARLEDYRAHLARMTRDGSWWWASNAAYREADGAGAAHAFGVRFWPDPGGVSATGCLWSIVDEAPAAVFWTFHEGWDAAAGRAFVYQSHTSGAGAGMGYRLAPAGDTLVLEQDFRWSDGSTPRVRHEETWPDEDTHVGASLTWTDGRWTPSRSYTWERRRGGDLPCGPG